MDDHWRPISDLCSLCSKGLNYNVIIKYENMAAEEREIIFFFNFKTNISRKKRKSYFWIIFLWALEQWYYCNNNKSKTRWLRLILSFSLCLYFRPAESGLNNCFIYNIFNFFLMFLNQKPVHTGIPTRDDCL